MSINQGCCYQNTTLTKLKKYPCCGLFFYLIPISLLCGIMGGLILIPIFLIQDEYAKFFFGFFLLFIFISLIFITYEFIRCNFILFNNWLEYIFNLFFPENGCFCGGFCCYGGKIEEQHIQMTNLPIADIV